MQMRRPTHQTDSSASRAAKSFVHCKVSEPIVLAPWREISVCRYSHRKLVWRGPSRLDGSSRTRYLRQSVNNTASAGVPKGSKSAIFAESSPCAMPSLRSHSKCLVSIFWYIKNNVSAPSGSQFFLSINEHGVIVHGGMIRRISTEGR